VIAMSQSVFTRYEEKYLLTEKQKNDMFGCLAHYLPFDSHSPNGASYNVYSLYFDTSDNNVIRQSLEKPKFKEKLRIRCYEPPKNDSDPVFLEIKKKDHGIINKSRIVIGYGKALEFVATKQIPAFLSDDYFTNRVANEIEYMLEQNTLTPSYFICYKRQAFAARETYFRVTFDHDILYRNTEPSLLDLEGQPVIPADKWLMEIKAENNYPLWLVRKLSELGLANQSFSKFGRAYQNTLKGEF